MYGEAYGIEARFNSGTPVSLLPEINISFQSNHVSIQVIFLVHVHCAHAYRQPRGFHLSWNEHLYRSAHRRPQLNPRDPNACGPRRFDALASCVYAARPLSSWLPATEGPRKQGFPHMSGRCADSGNKIAASAHGMGSGGLAVDAMAIGCLGVERRVERFFPYLAILHFI